LGGILRKEKETLPKKKKKEKYELCPPPMKEKRCFKKEKKGIPKGGNKGETAFPLFSREGSWLSISREQKPITTSQSFSKGVHRFGTVLSSFPKQQKITGPK